MVIPVLLFALIATGSFRAPAAAATSTIYLQVENLSRAEGRVWVGIYRSAEDFLDKENALLLDRPVDRTGTLLIEIPDLPRGQYALAIFHDENDNGRMDRNLLGIPCEPFSFVKRPRSKWRLPRFEEVALEFREPEVSLRALLKRWRKW